MAAVQRYRIVALAAVVAASLGIFLGFFFLFVLAPIAVIALFYIVYFLAEERLALSRTLRHETRERRERLARESAARRRVLRRRRDAEGR